MNLDTINGLNLPTMAQIEQRFVTQINKNIDPSFIIQNENIVAQIIVILSQEVSDLMDTLQACFDVVNGKATADNLIDYCKWVGVTKTEATATKVYLLLTSSEALTFPANTSMTASGFTISNPNDIFINSSGCAQASVEVLSAVESQHYTFEINSISIDYIANPSDTPATIALALKNLVLSEAPLFTASIDPENTTTIIINRTTDGQIDYSQYFSVSITTPTYLNIVNISAYDFFLNSQAGNISITTGTFDLTSTPVAGVASLQPEDGINGQDEENDQQLRVKRDQSVAFGGSRTYLAIQSALLNTTYVKKAAVYQNTEDTPLTIDTGITLVPHSIYAVVLGGYKVDIANTIFNRMSEGIKTNKILADNAGGTSVYVNAASYPLYNYTDQQLINFDYAEQISVKINVVLTIDRNLIYKIDKNSVTDIISAIYNYISTLGIGETMYIESIKSVAGCVVEFGVKTIVATYNVIPSATVETTDLAILKNQIIVADINNITASVVSS